jgi:ubiquinone/menaquinone biosynthesis C-methylase UbiE
MSVQSPSAQTRDEAITLAYRLYAKFYQPVALLVFLVIWRGSLRKHLAWYAKALRHATGKRHLDVATGDGGLFELCYKKAGKPRFQSLICLDLSPDMLAEAAKRLKTTPRAELVLGSILAPPPLEAFDSVSCFGGFNVFEDIEGALKQICGLLKPGGSFSGSALLKPEAPWRRREVEKYSRKGYMTRCPSLDEFKASLKAAGLTLLEVDRHGDNFLFRAIRPVTQEG